MEDSFIYNKIDWKVPIERSLLVNTEIDHSSMRLYLILLSYARDKITAFPSRDTLAKDMGCSVRNVDLLKKKLQSYKLLAWNTTFYGQKKHNTYHLLQYQPIKASMRQNIARGTGKKLPVNNKQVKNKTTASSRFNNIVNNWSEQYKEICNNISPDLRSHIQSGWINNGNYSVTGGDKRNLEQYYQENGDAGLKKLEISFQYLKDYIEDKVEYGQFYNTNGAELIPTISLFTKAKIQHDGIMEFATHKLRILNKEFE